MNTVIDESSQKIKVPIAVASKTFFRHQRLRQLLLDHFENIRFNETDKMLSETDLVSFLQEARGAIVSLEPITKDLIEQLPDLRYISKFGVGLNNLDMEAIEQRKIQWGWSGGVNKRSVSELTLAFILGLLRNVFQSGQTLKAGQWVKEGGCELTGKTVGIIGFGHIGQDLAKLLKPFQGPILVHDIRDVKETCLELGATPTPLTELLQQSQVVTLHVPYDKTTHHLIDAKQLALMPPHSILINTSRGHVVNEEALYEALTKNQIRGAASDVFAVEPVETHPLLQLPQFFGTPHIGGSSAEAIWAMGSAAVLNLKRIMSS